MTQHITVVGSINMDLVFYTPRMPALGETIAGTDFCQVSGGKGANQAVAAARQGAAVHFIGAVGADGFGHTAMRCLVGEGIAIDGVSAVSGVPTGVAGIFVDADGGNSIVLSAGANDTLSTAQVDLAATTIATAGYLICQLETPLATVTRAIEIARANKVQVVLNPAPAQALPDELLACIDYLIVNETEASQLSGIIVSDHASVERAAGQLRDRGAGTVLVTLGEDGVFVAQADGGAFHAAIKVPAVDTTGAGDTFVGAFTAALLRGLAMMDAVAEAQCAAALTVMKMGAQAAIPTRAELLHMMEHGHADAAAAAPSCAST